MADYDSRTADKFVMRMPPGMRAQVTELANQQHISMNSWIVQAVEEKLNRAVRQELLLGALEAAVLTKIEVEIAPDVEPLPFWEPCNPGCDPEFNGKRSNYCGELCEGARKALQGGDA